MQTFEQQFSTPTPEPKDPVDVYRDSHGTAYASPEEVGFLSIPVLTFLVGNPWDRAALNFVHGLRPSMVRVTEGEVTEDFRPHRVTVFLSPSNLIERIEQEVEVGTVGFPSSHDLMAAVLANTGPGETKSRGKGTRRPTFPAHGSVAPEEESDAQ